MKITKLPISFALAFIFCWAAAGQGRGLSLKQWQAGYDKATRGFDHKDFKSGAAYFAADWKHFTPRGKVDQTGNNPASMAKAFGGMKTIHLKEKVLSVRNKGRAIIVHCHYAFSLWTRPGDDKKSHHILDQGLANDIWTKSHGKWLISETHALTMKVTMDGRPFNPRK